MEACRGIAGPPGEGRAQPRVPLPQLLEWNVRVTHANVHSGPCDVFRDSHALQGREAATVYVRK